MMIPHFYDFSVVRFKLPSRERLVKRLGEYDALAEFAVLSFYDFETIARSVQDTYKFVCDKAREYDVKIKGTVSMENYHVTRCLTLCDERETCMEMNQMMGLMVITVL